MIIYRICNQLYSKDLTGTGAKLFGGRWNSIGLPMLYAAEHISLAALEMLVHNQFTDFSVELSLIHILIPDNTVLKEIKLNKLKNDWVDDIGYTKFMGNEFIKSNGNLLLKVPSAVVHEEYNLLLNPLHNDFKKVKILKTTNFSTDKRLFKL